MHQPSFVGKSFNGRLLPLKLIFSSVSAFVLLWWGFDFIAVVTTSGQPRPDATAAYTGAPAARQALEQSLARPLALAVGDFDEDGAPDLAAGYVGGQGGILSLHRGNVDAIYPNTPTAKQRWGDRPPPFLSPARVFDLPVAADFTGAGDFNADGHLDLVVAARGDLLLYLLVGDGRGGFDTPRPIEVPGRVTALVAGEINRADGLADVVVGVSGDGGAQALVFEGPEGALRARPEAIVLPEEATELALGQVDGDHLFDLAAAAGRELVIVAGRDRRLSLGETQHNAAPPARIVRQELPAAAKSMALGNFTGGRRTQIAALCVDGAVRLLSVSDDWSEWRSESVHGAAWPRANRLLAASMTGGSLHDLVVLDGEARRLQVVSGERGGAMKAAAIEVESLPAAAAAMRLSIHARSSLVLLGRGRAFPEVVSPQVAATFTVDSTFEAPDSNVGDGLCRTGTITAPGPCTLRAAIQEANATAAADTINFNIGEGGARTINLSLRLPTITAPVTIDGTTQPGVTGRPPIELNGEEVVEGDGVARSGLVLLAANCVVRGLVINRFGGDGILSFTSGHVIEGNYIGTDAFGAESLANGLHGVESNSGSNITIGGTAAGARNVISGNGVHGIFLFNSATGNVIRGNYIGVNAAGAAELGNGGNGVALASGGNTVGGTAAGARNIISGNGGHGVGLASNCLVQGNYIGTNAAGAAELGNGLDGVMIDGASGNTIGGTVPGAGNLISGNNTGIAMAGATVMGNLVQGNRIGTNAAGTTDLGNFFDGVLIGPGSFGGAGFAPGFSRAGVADITNNAIGGVVAGAGNVIAFNGREFGNGVTIINTSSTNASLVNPILSNLIFGNRGLGIDLGGNRVTPNDAGDGDTGPNNLQNYPVLASAAVAGATTTIRGTLNSAPNATFRIEFFANAACDGSGFGEGETLLGFTSVTTSTAGTASFSVDLPVAVAVGRSITATATDTNGNTSEFSNCATVAVCPVYPSGFVPFTQVDSVAGPAANGDRVIVGRSTIGAFNTIRQSLPLPQFPNEHYCAEVELAPGVLAVAYVPSVAERAGDFSSFGAPIIDPLTGMAFPNNIIPANRLPSTYAWRIRSFRIVDADLALTKGDAPDPIFVNNLLTYTLNVTNNGPGVATGVSLVDTLPPNVTLSSAGPTQGRCSPDGNAIFCDLGTIQPGARVTVTIIVNVATAAAGTLTNTATVRASQNDPRPGDNTATATTTVNPIANMVLAKTAAPLLPGPGEDLIYTLRVQNTGPNAATDVVLTDPIPANTAFKLLPDVTGWTCTRPSLGGGGAVTCRISTLPPGATATFTLTTTVNNNVAGGSTIANTAQVTATSFDNDAANNTATFSVRTGAPQIRIPTVVPLEIGPVVALPAPSQNPAAGDFVIENTGSATLFLTPVSLLRQAPNADRLTPPADDRSLFDVRYAGPEGEVPLLYTANGVIAMSAGQQLRFRTRFNPIIPIRACRTSGLAANQAVPDTITSQLTLVTQSGVPVRIDLVGRVTPAAKLVHPLDPRRAPHVTLTQSGQSSKVEYWVYDPNMDIYLARYEFLNSAGNRVGAPVDVDLAQEIAAANLMRGQIFGIEQSFESAAAVASVRVIIFDRDNNNVSAVSGPGGPTDCSIGTVSAASFTEFGLAGESIVAGFGSNLAGAAVPAQAFPLPTELAGASIKLRDGAGVERLTPLFFVSPTQINYLIPAGVAPGAATITVTNANNVVAMGVVRITDVGPGLFSADGNGAGVAAAVALRVKADGSQQFEPVARFDPRLGRHVAIPINPGEPSDQVFLILYGTGLRQRRALDAVRVQVDGLDVPVLYAGTQGELTGLDQVNISLPRDLSGRGEVDVVLTVDGFAANTVRISLAGVPSLAAGPATAVAPLPRPYSQGIARRAVIVLPPIRLGPAPAGPRR